MASRLTQADVERIAALAHLELTPEEKALFTRQLAQILDWAEQLREVDTTAVSATWHPRAGSAELRADEPRPSLAREDALAGAPDAVPEGLFRVPRVIG